MADQPPATCQTTADAGRPAQQAYPAAMQGTMMLQPQHRGVQLQQGQSQCQSQGQGQSQKQSQGQSRGDRHAPDQPVEQLDGDAARQADGAPPAPATGEAQAGERETDTASADKPAAGSREAGVAQSGKEDLIDGEESAEAEEDFAPEEFDPKGHPARDYAQYEVNMPQNMPQHEADDRRKREQAEMQERQQPEMDERGYGGASEERAGESDQD